MKLNVKNQLFLLNILLFSLFIARAQNQVLGSFKITTKEFPVPVFLVGVELPAKGQLVARNKKSGKIQPVQRNEAGAAAKFWMMAEVGAHEYDLMLLDTNVNDRVLKKHDGAIIFKQKKKNLLAYQYETTKAPQGVDDLFAKSGYIHPLYAPSGMVLTRIQPSDHYHHYGIWGPWTRTSVFKKPVDFWNLGDGMGTVNFSDLKSSHVGSVFSEMTVMQEHTVLNEEQPFTALNELLTVRVWNRSSDDNRYIVDYISRIETPLNEAVKLHAYRYGGGLGFRATEFWKADNCTVLTSEGKDRLEADGSKAKWCIVEGEDELTGGRSGILFLSHPENRAHPEPMRVWPIDGNGGRGDMFFEFCPIRHESWSVDPGKQNKLYYRMIVFSGEISADEAEAYWRSFAYPLEIQVKR